MSTMYALLEKDSPEFTNESLAEDFKNLFKKEKGFSIKFQKLPFSVGEVILMQWDGAWSIQASVEEGPKIKKDSEEIKKILGVAAPENIENVTRRIRVVFKDDPKREFTDQIIDTMQFLTNIPNSVVFDKKQEDLLKKY